MFRNLFNKLFYKPTQEEVDRERRLIKVLNQPCYLNSAILGPPEEYAVGKLKKLELGTDVDFYVIEKISLSKKDSE